MNIHLVPGSTDVMVQVSVELNTTSFLRQTQFTESHPKPKVTSFPQAMLDGHCDGVVDTWPNTEAAATAQRFCNHEIAVIGRPLSMGPQDIAVGVHADMLDTQLAISYWIQQLRSCNPLSPGSVCYNSLNMKGLYNRTILTARQLRRYFGFNTHLFLWLACTEGCAFYRCAAAQVGT